MRKKKTKVRYDPFTALHPVSLRPELEGLARDLYQLACKGSEPVWAEMNELTSLGLNITNFLERLKQAGMTVREATNKEASQMEQKGGELYKWKGRAIFIGNGKDEVCISPGLFIRILFHGQRPIETAQAIINNNPKP